MRDLINILEENINEKDEKKPKISTAKNTRKKIDILRMKSSPISISKKSVTPTRKSKFSEKKSEKIIEKISEENLICNRSSKTSLKGGKMRTTQKTIRDIWGPDVSKNGPKVDQF